jgi:hypothetical protein
MMTATHPHPTRNPITDVSEGIIISRLVFGSSILFLGTTASAGSVHGAFTCSPGRIGVRTSA